VTILVPAFTVPYTSEIAITSSAALPVGFQSTFTAYQNGLLRVRDQTGATYLVSPFIDDGSVGTAQHITYSGGPLGAGITSVTFPSHSFIYA
jgi:hypothetical protein